MQSAPPQNWFCPRCGSHNLSVAVQCSHCQSPNPFAVPAWQPPPPPQVIHVIHQAPPKSRAAYIIIGLLIGALGIHNFYAGHHGRGVAQLLITLLGGWLCFPVVIVWVWVIIEVIATDTDGLGRKMV